MIVNNQKKNRNDCQKGMRRKERQFNMRKINIDPCCMNRLLLFIVIIIDLSSVRCFVSTSTTTISLPSRRGTPPSSLFVSSEKKPKSMNDIPIVNGRIINSSNQEEEKISIKKRSGKNIGRSSNKRLTVLIEKIFDDNTKTILPTKKSSATTKKKNNKNAKKHAKQSSSKSTSKVVAVQKTNKTKINSKDEKWNHMIELFRQFQKEYQHSLVTAENSSNYPGLLQWTLSVRRNYRYQVKGSASHHHQQQHDELEQQNQQETISTTTKIATNTIKKRPFLSNHKMQQLLLYDFAWDVQDYLWKRRYDELMEFYTTYGHCNVRLIRQQTRQKNYNKNDDDESLTRLLIWIQNQRKEYKKYQSSIMKSNKVINSNTNITETKTKSSLSTIKLNMERIQLLQKVNFFHGYQSHEETWSGRYQQLKCFFIEYNHSNVPVNNNNYLHHKNNNHHHNELGTWCNNQRTSYRLYQLGERSAMSINRIHKLNELNFQWQYRQSKWYIKLRRLKQYYDMNGHVTISTDDINNQDLRIWLIVQRFLHNNRYVNRNNDNNITNSLTTTIIKTKKEKRLKITQSRIDAIEQMIPNFSWKARESTGPSSLDWEKLFNAMRDKGIQPGMKPKQHWFQGTNPFSTKVKDTYTEQDLLELWYQEEDDDDNDDDIIAEDLDEMVIDEDLDFYNSNPNGAQDDIDDERPMVSVTLDDEGNMDESKSEMVKEQLSSKQLSQNASKALLRRKANSMSRLSNRGAFRTRSQAIDVRQPRVIRRPISTADNDDTTPSEAEILFHNTKKKFASTKKQRYKVDVQQPLAISSLLTGSAEQIVRQRLSYSDLKDIDDDDDAHDHQLVSIEKKVGR